MAARFCDALTRLTERQIAKQSPLLENATLASALGAAPTELLVTALASAAPGPVGDLMAQLRAHASSLKCLVDRGSSDIARRPATLGPELEIEPARVRPDLGDHQLRGKLLFRDLVGQRSFFQVAAWSIAGLELSIEDAQLLEHLGVNTQLLDPHIWPLAVARRIAAGGAPLVRSVVGDLAVALSKNITVAPVAAFIQLLDALDSATLEGRSVVDEVEAILRRQETAPGFGRPVLGPDERVPHAVRLAHEHGRGRGHSLALARAVEDVLRARKGPAINSAGVQGAIMRDMGFSPDAAAAFCTLYFLVPVVAQHAFVRERARPSGGGVQR
ncbi:MAG: hypothetical protein M3O36_17295 [Myxococcota bacterium]|nr:hypothetical protein [Myxococcota bacterium]